MFAGDFACQYLSHRSAVARAAAAGSQAQASANNTAAVVAPPPARLPTALLPALPPSLRGLFPSWWDESRGLSFLLTGLAAGGPFQLLVQRGAERLFPGRAPRAIACKLGLSIGTAPVMISSTFYFSARFQGHDHRHCVSHVRANVLDVWVAGFVFWPAVHWASLRFLTVDARPIAGSVAQACWSTYLSWKANRERETDSSAEQGPPLPPLTVPTAAASPNAQ